MLLVSCLVEPRLSVTGVTLEILTAKVLPIRYDIVPQKLGQRIVMKADKPDTSCRRAGIPLVAAVTLEILTAKVGAEAYR